MTKPRIEFWFDFASTYSYLSAMRLATLAQKSGVAFCQAVYTARFAQGRCRAPIKGSCAPQHLPLAPSFSGVMIGLNRPWTGPSGMVRSNARPRNHS